MIYTEINNKNKIRKDYIKLFNSQFKETEIEPYLINISSILKKANINKIDISVNKNILKLEIPSNYYYSLINKKGLIFGIDFYNCFKSLDSFNNSFNIKFHNYNIFDLNFQSSFTIPHNLNINNNFYEIFYNYTNKSINRYLYEINDFKGFKIGNNISKYYVSLYHKVNDFNIRNDLINKTDIIKNIDSNIHLNIYKKFNLLNFINNRIIFDIDLNKNIELSYNNTIKLYPNIFFINSNLIIHKFINKINIIKEKYVSNEFNNGTNIELLNNNPIIINYNLSFGIHRIIFFNFINISPYFNYNINKIINNLNNNNFNHNLGLFFDLSLFNIHTILGFNILDNNNRKLDDLIFKLKIYNN